MKNLEQKQDEIEKVLLSRRISPKLPVDWLSQYEIKPASGEDVPDIKEEELLPFIQTASNKINSQEDNLNILRYQEELLVQMVHILIKYLQMFFPTIKV